METENQQSNEVLEQKLEQLKNSEQEEKETVSATPSATVSSDNLAPEEHAETKTYVSTEKPDSKIYDTEPHWYVLHTFSGYEQVAKTNLEMVVKKYNLENRIFDIIIPMEDTIEEKNGKKKLVSRKVMPCYLIVKMIYGDDMWHNITRTRGITGFVGPKGRPLALTQEEIRKLHLETVIVNIDLRPNDKIEVIDGPLNTFIGTVISVDPPSRKCRVNIEMFGRETPVDLEFSQIRKI